MARNGLGGSRARFQDPTVKDSDRMSVSGSTVRGVDMETHAVDTEIVSPGLTLGGLLQKFRFGGGFVIYT